MGAWRLFPEGTVPEQATAAWHRDREAVDHLAQPGHRQRLLLARGHVAAFLDEHGAGSVVDLGAGDGGLLSLLNGQASVWGYDLCPANVLAATRRGVKVALADLCDYQPRWADVVVMTEFLEHLVDPGAMLRRAADHCRYLVASSPWDEGPGNHPDYHLWAWDTHGYRELAEASGWRVVRHQRVGRFQVLSALARHQARREDPAGAGGPGLGAPGATPPAPRVEP